MTRVEENKQKKLNSLMDTAFRLFTLQGVAKTSIADIAAQASVAKGTFYLYFKDKYDLHEKLVISKSEQLFLHALEHSAYREKATPEDRILAIVDDILRQFEKNTVLLQFINKNLSWGVFRRAIVKSDHDYHPIFEEILGQEYLNREDLPIAVYTILELVGSSCYTVILKKEPADLDHYLPYLHRAIRAIIHSFNPDAAGNSCD